MTTVVEYYIPKADRKATVKELAKYFDKKYCTKIEHGLFDYAEQYCSGNGSSMEIAPAVYSECVRNLLYNCAQGSRTIRELASKINNGKYNPYNLAFLRPDELDEDNWFKIILRRNTTEDRLKNLPTIEWKVCKLCKNTKYFYYQLQTRSADEAMTTFYICKECNKTYKVNN